jgi:hypothetical protein
MDVIGLPYRLSLVLVTANVEGLRITTLPSEPAEVNDPAVQNSALTEEPVPWASSLSWREPRLEFLLVKY